MYILEHWDWYGSIEEVEKWDKVWKRHFDGSAGVKWLGRFGPQNKKYHWTYIWKAKDWDSWHNKTYPEESASFKRDYKVYSHVEYEFYSDV